MCIRDSLNPDYFDMIIDSDKEWQTLYEGEVLATPDLIIALSLIHI